MNLADLALIGLVKGLTDYSSIMPFLIVLPYKRDSFFCSFFLS